MIKFLSLLFSTTMHGIVDQVDGHIAIVELVAKDGHTHEINLPLWMFPCSIQEGTGFSIDMKIDSTTIYCDN
jgi:hypothetical protein